MRVEVRTQPPPEILLKTARTVTAFAVATSFGLAFAPAAPQSDPSLDDVPYLVTDTAGDANGINSQGNSGLLALVTGDPNTVPSTSTAPAQLEEADILGARMTATFQVVTVDDVTEHVYDGIEFRTALAAQPAEDGPGLLYRFNVTAGGCAFFVQYQVGIDQPNDSSIRYSNGCATEGGTVPDLSSQFGPFVTHRWDETNSELVVRIDHATAPGVVKPLLELGDKVQLDALEVRGYAGTSVTGGALVPVWDDVLGDGSKDQRYEVGSDIPEPGDEGGDDDTGGGDPSLVDCDREPVAHDHQVFSFGFSPADAELCVGDTVTWTALSGTHNATAFDGSFASATISTGETSTVEITQAGIVDYRCTIHPGSMTGTFTIGQ